jgi:PEGA domain
VHSVRPESCRRVFAPLVLFAIVVAPSWSTGATGAATTSGHKTTMTMPTKSSKAAGLRGFGVSHGFGWTALDSQSFLIMDAAPAEAQVFLDGRLLGSAADILARAMPIAPGRHIAQVVAPGFTPYVARFAADPGFSTRLRVALPHE